MAGETQTRVPETGRSGWTSEILLDHVLAIIGEKHAQLLTVIAGNDRRYEERFASLKSENIQALSAADRAVQKAEMATEKRFESVNEFRGTLDQQQRTLIPRSEVAVLVEGLNEKIGNLTKVVDELKAIVSALQAERQGIKGGWGYAAAVFALVLTMVSIGVLIMKGFGN
jgi:hypothetical protein